MAFFIMECDGPYPTMPIRASEETNHFSSPWNRGTAFSDTTLAKIKEPIAYVNARSLDPEEPQNLKAMYKAEAVPLMRDDLVDALLAAGVKNLQLFPALIRNAETGECVASYKAFNVVGLVACADQSASLLLGTTGFNQSDTDFDSLVINESKAGAEGLLLFRIAENISAIAVHASVKQEIEKRGIPGMVFYGPGEWCG